MRQIAAFITLAIIASIVIIYLVACAPTDYYGTIANEKASGSYTFETIAIGGRIYGWKFKDTSTGAICYGNTDGGLVCNFK